MARMAKKVEDPPRAPPRPDLLSDRRVYAAVSSQAMNTTAKAFVYIEDAMDLQLERKGCSGRPWPRNAVGLLRAL